MPHERIQKLNDAALFRTKAYINGKWMEAADGTTFSVDDPSTGKEIATAPEMGVKEVQLAIKAAHQAYEQWRQTTSLERYNKLLEWARLVDEHQKDLATILTLENGKPYAEAIAEVGYARSFIQWFGEEAKRVYGDVVPAPKSDTRFLVVKQPVGVCSIIIPWNFPSAMGTRKAAAALAAGCTVVIKPAAQTPYSTLALCELAERAGIPKGVINVVTTDAHIKEVGREMCINELVRKVSFTGSIAVGKLIMEQCAQGIKKVSLELGGNAPFIVFGDANVDAAVDGLMAAKMRNSGQVCIAPNRIYVHDDIHDTFTERLTEKLRKLRVGGGFEEGVTTGPLISARAQEKVHRHVEDAVKKGGRLLLDGRKDQEKQKSGYFFHPTLLTDLKDEALVVTEETFGPLLAVRRFKTEEEVIKLANNTTAGLAAYMYTRDVGRVFRVSEAIEAGMVGVNSAFLSAESTPFGGVKESGIGRESSKYGLDEYTEMKTIAIAF